MYEFFCLKREPFSVAADPRFIYMSPIHRQALAHLEYGLRRGAGFILLTGEIGAGKTTVSRLFLRRLPPTADVALVVNPRLDAAALLARICEDLRINLPAGTVDLIDAIHGHLLLAHADRRRTLIVIDEAQALSVDALEQLRLLTNLDSSGGKLQVFLIGQPELRSMLQQPALEPLAQRVVARFHLATLPEDETARYIAHRLSVAGLVGPLPFDEPALQSIHSLCAGVPRRINVLCDRAMHLAETSSTHMITRPIVEQAATEVFAGPPATSPATEPEPRAPARVNEPSRWPASVSPALAGAAGAVLLGGAMLGGAIVGAAMFGSAMLGRDRPTQIASDSRAPRVPAISAPAAPTSASPTAGGSPAATPTAAQTAGQAGVAAAAVRQIAVPEAPAVSTPSLPAAPLPTGGMAAVFELAVTEDSAAWRNLAQLWGVTLGPGQSCAVAPAAGLRCYRVSGGLETIRQLDRPGFLKLVREDQRVVYAALVGLTDVSAIFRSGGAQQIVPLSDLAGRWHGDYATLWRPPSGYRNADSVSAGGPLTDWLSQKLSIIHGAASTAADAGSLPARLAEFQLSHGLEPDGRPGPLTLMQINRLSGVDEPRLNPGR